MTPGPFSIRPFVSPDSEMCFFVDTPSTARVAAFRAYEDAGAFCSIDVASHPEPIVSHNDDYVAQINDKMRRALETWVKYDKALCDCNRQDYEHLYDEAVRLTQEVLAETKGDGRDARA
jgi:hypothetical protein